MNEIYKMRIEFLKQFGDYLLKNLGECEFLLWKSVLENNFLKNNLILYEINILYWTAIDERAWHDAVTAFANLTEDIRKVSLG